MKPKVLVLGATGFAGAHVARALENRGYRVRAGRRTSSPMWHVDDLQAQWAELQLDTGVGLDEAMEGCAAVVDCAGYQPSQSRDVDRGLRRGVGRLRRVLDACRRHDIARVVFMSCPTTLGAAAADAPADESDFYTPGSVDNAYFETKYAMESELYRYLLDGLAATVVIPGMMFGPGDVSPGSGELVIRLVDQRLPVTVSATFNAVDVRDVANSTVNALERGRPGRRYILGGHNVEVGTVAEVIAELAGVAAPKRQVPGPAARRLASWFEPIDRKLAGGRPTALMGLDFALNTGPVVSDRAAGELDHQARSLERTLGDAVDWFREHGYVGLP